MTDYQLLSEILRLATVDLRSDSITLPMSWKTTEHDAPERLEVVPMTHQKDVPMTPPETPVTTDRLMPSVENNPEETTPDQPEPVNDAAVKKASKFPSFVVKAAEARKKLADL
jgi:hypothetical protein